jgi:hypothetical protein
MAFTPGTRQTIHYTQLPDMTPDRALYHEYNLFRRELPRLLAEGHEGKFILIKGSVLLGPYATREEAKQVAYEKYPLQDFMVQQVLEYQPVYRVSCQV